MYKKSKKIAVLLHNMGGPSSLVGIKDFLYNLFKDSDLIPFPRPIAFLQKPFAKLISYFRAPKVAVHYDKIGGASPILPLTIKQKDALQLMFDRAGLDVKVFIAMRYSKPFVFDSMLEVLSFKPDFIIHMPLYPHYSSTTTGSSFNEVGYAIMKLKVVIPNFYICDWHDNSYYIDALCFNIKDKLATFKNPDLINILFSAHSLPSFIIKKGDVYRDQVENTFDLVRRKLDLPCNFYLSYQSRVGPIEWIGPQTDDMICEIAKKVNNDILIVPISFVSDHYETDYEIDIEYLELAKDKGITEFKRIDSLNDGKIFIDALFQVVMDKIYKEDIL